MTGKKKADRQAGENAGNQKQILANACKKIYLLNREKAALKAEHIDPITEEIKHIRKTEVMGDADITAKAFKIHHYQPYADARDIELMDDETEKQIAREQIQVARESLSLHENLDLFAKTEDGDPATTKVPLPKSDAFEDKFGGGDVPSTVN